MKLQPDLRQGLYALILIIAAALNFKNPVFLDDAYITFRAAKHCAEGQGLSFNPEEKVLSTSAPGYALLLAGCSKLGMDTVFAARLLCTLSILVSSLMLFLLGKKRDATLAGFGSGLVLAIFPDLAKAWGNEVPLLVFFAVGAILAFEFRRPLVSGGLAAAGCMIRPDFGLLALILAVFWLMQNRRAFCRYVVIGVIASAAWLLLLYNVSGTVVPHTLEIKRQQGLWLAVGDPRAFTGWIDFLAGFKWLLHRIVLSQALGILVIYGGLVILGKRDASWMVIVVWSALHLVAYYLIRVPGFYAWYYYPVWISISVGFGVGLATLSHLIARRGATDAIRIWHIEALALSIALFCAGSLRGLSKDEWAERKFQSYSRISEIIKEKVPANESVMMSEIGQVGYLTDRRIVDLFGIVHDPKHRDAFGDLVKMTGIYKPDYFLEQGWLAFAKPEYANQVSAGTYEVNVGFPDGQVIKYKQIASCYTYPDHLPVLMKRQ